MAPLLFINKSSQSESLSRSSGKERFLISSHASRQFNRRFPRLSELPISAAQVKTTDHNHPVFLQLATSKSDAGSEKQVVPETETESLRKRTPTALMGQISPSGQSLDPFGSTALRIHRDACNMISYFLAWTTPRENVLTIEPDQNQLSYRVAMVRPNEVVKKAVADELHMASLLSFVVCLMDAEQPGHIGLLRIWEMTNQALALLRKRLQGQSPSDLVFDILNLAYSAPSLRETAAARRHVRALRDLVASEGSFGILAPHTLPSIMYADVCCSLPGLRSTVFDMTKHDLPQAPPMPWDAVPSLHKEAQLVQMQLSSCSSSEQCKEYAVHILEMAQVLRHSQDGSQQQLSNEYWVMLKCLTLISNLLARFRRDTEFGQGCRWGSVAFPSDNATDSNQLETTKICLLLWLQLLRMVAGGQAESSKFMPAFESPLLHCYKSAGLGQRIFSALSSWNDLLSPCATTYDKMESTTPVLTAADLASNLAIIITHLEGGSSIQLGKFMSHFLYLEHRTRPQRPTVNSLALITSNTVHEKPTMYESTPAAHSYSLAVDLL